MQSLLKISAVLAFIAGVVMVFGGAWGTYFTYQNVVRENIMTPQDASIPNAKVLGPFTLKAQADIIRDHTLQITGGKTYAEMPRFIPRLDEEGREMIGTDGTPVMVPNEARNIWITATALMTALHLGIVTYVFSGLVLLFGLISIWTGIVFFVLSKKQ